MQELVAGADYAGEAGFVKPHFLEEDHSLVHVHGDQVGLDRRRNHHRLGALGMSFIEYARGLLVAASRLVLVDVADVEHGLGRQQLGLGENPGFLLVLGLGQPRRLAFAQQLERLA